MRFARVEQGVVREIVEQADMAALRKSFHPNLANQFFECGADVIEGWLFDGAFKAPPALPAPLPPELDLADRILDKLVERGVFTVADKTAIEASLDAKVELEGKQK